MGSAGERLRQEGDQDGAWGFCPRRFEGGELSQSGEDREDRVSLSKGPPTGSWSGGPAMTKVKLPAFSNMNSESCNSFHYD